MRTYKIDDRIYSDFEKSIYHTAFRAYCKDAGALLDCRDPKTGDIEKVYDTSKMVETYGEDYMTKFDNWVNDEKRKARARGFIGRAIEEYLVGMYDNLKLNKEDK